MKLLCILGKTGYILLATAALLPLAPAIGVMWFAKWLHAIQGPGEFVTVYGQGPTPVRCPRQDCARCVRWPDALAEPYKHPAAYSAVRLACAAGDRRVGAKQAK
jgi:hypothetical protein